MSNQKQSFQCYFNLINLCISIYDGVFDTQSISLMNFTHLPSKIQKKKQSAVETHKRRYIIHTKSNVNH